MIALNKIVVFGMILVFLASFVSADSLCKESDNGKEYDKKGYVKYGVTQYDDLCVLKPDADMRLPESQYLKEYYCDTDTRMHKIVDCKKEGYEKCKDGACVSPSTTTTGNTTSNTTHAPVYVAPYCGDKKVGTGEECDPPDKICYKGADIGLCSTACKCVIKISGGHVVSSNQTAAKPEITIQDASANNKSSATQVTTAKAEVKEDVKEQTAVAKTPAKSAKKEVTDPDGVSTEKERLSLPKEQKKGLFKRMWSWLFG